ncbi:MAG: helix-turn-helix domain-containing protein [Lachnospiraceae bacterium]|nr:helix-turn-helix domain-containing protein [Lachnospiraceae bacterium]MBR0087229.1 helix-turn-helix domain-containing protein [Lachnospiraceae bacterium]
MGRRSVKENKNPYQLSREAAGLTREEASEKLVYISADRIEKIESGRLAAHPEEVMTMASVYKNVMLNNYYCSHECPIGQKYVPELKMKDISQITLELLNSVNLLNQDKERFLEIMVDGEIQDNEQADFEEIKKNLEEISASVRMLDIWLEHQALLKEKA